MKKVNLTNAIRGVLSFNAYLIFVLVLISTTSCGFLEVDLPKSRIANETVFADDHTATSAITGIYNEMMNGSNFASGSDRSITGLCGLSSDELQDVWMSRSENVEFSENRLTKDNSQVLDLWESMYKIIYYANSAIEGLNNSTNITAVTKEQLMGEALFVRAFTHFYLVNLFGAVPLVTSTDYNSNSRIGRVDAPFVYIQIIEDLTAAEELLSEAYVTTERIRPNKFAARALLARVYLYLGDWDKAEEYASLVIENPSMYGLVADLNEVFLKNSNEAIWQIMPISLDGINGQTHESYFFNPSQVVYFNVLRKQSFEPGDKRQSEWNGYLVEGADTVYYPSKYKQYLATAALTESSMVLRFAEQYLIRAEARANSDNLPGAISDIDVIRGRAGIPLIQNINPGISKGALLLVIENERKLEMLAEWGHRWLDLKRTNRYSQILSTIKPDWSDQQILYPIPQIELNDNANLGNQNPGY